MVHSAASQSASPLDENDLILDSGATVSIFRSPKLLRNIRTCGTPIRIKGVAGTFLVHQVGNFGKLKEVYFPPQAAANIISLTQMNIAYRVCFDAGKNMFEVTTDNRVALFTNKLVFNPFTNKLVCTFSTRSRPQRDKPHLKTPF